MILDVGCGVMPEHSTTREAVGIDINFIHGKVSVDDPIIADAQNLPIRARVFKSFVACAILEHLNRPDQCLQELARVTTKDAYGVLNIPIHADTRKEVFKRFFKEFPCAILYTLKKMQKWRTYFKIDGLMHKNLMTLEYIEKFFKLDRIGIIENLRPHQWFIWRTPFWFLHRLGLINMLYVREMGEYEFCLSKE